MYLTSSDVGEANHLSAGREQVASGLWAGTGCWKGNAEAVGSHRPLLQPQQTANMFILCQRRML